MNNEQLQEVLRKHALWLEGSEEGERANLEGANLWGANLEGNNLPYRPSCDREFLFENLRNFSYKLTSLHCSHLFLMMVVVRMLLMMIDDDDG